MPGDTAPSIPDLLHDAHLLRGEYDAELGELRLVYECLRRHSDGTKMDDRTVTLHLSGVTTVTVAYDPVWPEERPSQFDVPGDARLSSLTPWPLPSMEVELSLDSVVAAESLALAARRERLIETNGPDAVRLVCLHLHLGRPAVPVVVAIRCTSIRPYASGQPLGLETWAEEFAAWWEGWTAEYGAMSSTTDEADERASPTSGDHTGRSCAPPRTPAFESPPTDAPDDLLAPIRVWFEAGLALDATRRVHVAPNLDEPAEEQIEAERAWMNGEGEREYAREVEDWWIEGNRANLRVSGVTHFMPTDGDPAEDQWTRWSFALRRRGELWQIHRHTAATDDGLASRTWARRFREHR